MDGFEYPNDFVIGENVLGTFIIYKFKYKEYILTARSSDDNFDIKAEFEVENGSYIIIRNELFYTQRQSSIQIWENLLVKI